MRIPAFPTQARLSDGAAERRRRLRRLLPGLIAAAIVPALAYVLVRPHVGSDAAALAITAVIPAVWTAARLIWRRRLDPIGVLSAAGLGITLLVLLFARGNTVLLELREAPLTGALGLIALGSVAARRPLLPVVMRLLGRPLPAGIPTGLITAIIGATLVIDAGVRLILALSLSTTAYLAIHREVSWLILGCGVALLVFLGKRIRAARTAALEHDDGHGPHA